MDRESIATWHARLLSHTSDPPPLPESTSPFLHWVDGSAQSLSPAARFEDDALWLLALRRDHTSAPPIDPAGMLFSSCRDARTLEVWTECELSSLQALVWIALQRASAALLERTLDAARWHIEHTQPDNATNHPWGIPAFLLLAMRDPALTHESELYASTLLHNSLVTSGTPDPLSARALTDAARQIASLLESDLLD